MLYQRGVGVPLERWASVDSGVNSGGLLSWFSQTPTPTHPLLSPRRSHDALGPELTLPASIEFRENCEYCILLMTSPPSISDSLTIALFFFSPFLSSCFVIRPSLSLSIYH